MDTTDVKRELSNGFNAPVKVEINDKLFDIEDIIWQGRANGGNYVVKINIQQPDIVESDIL